MHIFRRITATTLVLVAVLSLTANVAHAVDPVESITLTPTSRTYKVDAGQTFQDAITILNDGQTAYDFIVYTAPYSVTSGSYGPDFTSMKTNTDAYEWVQFSKTTWHLEPRQSVKVPYTVHVKEKAAPGGHYGVIFAETQPPADATSLARKKRVGSIIYATVNGDVNLSGSVESATLPWFQSSAPLTAQTTVKNTGNSDFVANVRLRVTDLFGSVKYENTGDYVVLPSTSRDIAMQWDKASWFGLYKAQFQVELLGNTTLTESYVLIMPVWLVLLFGFMVTSGALYGLWHRTNRSKQ